MQIEINTIEDMIHFIESHELSTKQVNELLSCLNPKCLFINDYTPQKRGEMLREFLSKPEWGIFVDAPDIGLRK
jgi:hypothetical protein